MAQIPSKGSGGRCKIPHLGREGFINQRQDVILRSNNYKAPYYIMEEKLIFVEVEAKQFI